jgi:zinc transport system substrate-binding protein
MMRWIVGLVIGMALGCAAETGTAPSAAIEVAASLPPHAWMIERLGGDTFSVRPMLRPGDSPATFQPGDAEVSRALASRTFFRAGVPFEAGGWFGAVAEHLRVVDLRDGVELRTITAHQGADHSTSDGHRHPDGAPDPHIWLSPKRLPMQARTIATALQQLHPASEAAIAERLRELEAELAALDHEIGVLLAPHRGRSFVVFHPSWGYLADDYGLHQVAIESGGKEPSDAEITRLREQIRSLGVTVVYVQPQIAGRSAAAVAEASGARLETLDPLQADVVANLRETARKLARSFDG